MWKQYNKLRDRSTVNMDVEELMSHQETPRLIETDLHFATRNAAEVQDEYNFYVLYFKLVCIVILVSMCYNFNCYVL
jgi:hypothetical protein